ncbi:MFS transporter [Octadecabacter sp. G9-8]|uniref:MFS transporter n=1 Tax=Octadecabacter dasysiphoniae TaxID=2909341 RepID=A0ABS9CU24_9RHOB|nr:MFS transporter [Octadecabacter dasysiphoniae]MCF2870743.1 MFS transporter [Octadecabacter dasysiphoniae]
MSSSLRSNINFIALISANTILSAAMPMLIILGGLAGLGLAPSPTLVTFPPSVQMLAGLLATGPFAWMMGRYGRKIGFIVGGALAVVGGALCVVALMQSSFFLLCIGHAALGAALACYQYFRFAAAEVVSEKWQPIAISLMLTSGLIAAFAGPQLFIITKDYIAAVPLAGAYGALSALSLIGIAPLLFMSKPVVSKQGVGARSDTNKRAALWHRPVLTAIVIGTVSQAIMVLLMSPTPLAMIGCGFSEETAGDVIRWHVVAMFAPSFVTGFLIKRYGVTPIAVIGLALTILSAAIAASGLTQPHFYGSLIVLGVGWNFGIIGATTMLVQVVPAEDRAFVQGANNTIIALVSTVCAFGSGAIVTSMGWTVLSLTAIPPLVLTLLFMARFAPVRTES